eukprot:RCo030245
MPLTSFNTPVEALHPGEASAGSQPASPPDPPNVVHDHRRSTSRSSGKVESYKIARYNIDTARSIADINDASYSPTARDCLTSRIPQVLVPQNELEAPVPAPYPAERRLARLWPHYRPLPSLLGWIILAVTLPTLLAGVGVWVVGAVGPSLGTGGSL